MILRASIAAAGLVVLSSCTTLSSGGLSAGPGRATSLAAAADPDFGAQLSRRDWRRLARAELRALDFVRGGQSASWGQPAGRARGTVKVSQPFSIASRECRRFTHDLTVRGQAESVTGVACRSEKGPWSLVS